MSELKSAHLLRGNAWIFRGLIDIDYEICSYNLVRDLRADTADSIEHGLPVVELRGIVDAVSQGDPLEVDLAAGRFRNLRSGKQLSFTPPPDFILEMIGAGGIYPLLTRMAKEGRLPKR